MHEKINIIQQPIFSIIMPAYNAENVIDNSIQSVIGQDFLDFELIVIDDGSKDSTKSIAEKYSEKDHRVKVITQPNAGVSSARNMGIKYSKGRFLMFLDSDDRYHSDYLSSVFREIEKDEQMVIVSFDLFKSKKRYKTECYINDKEKKISISKYLSYMLNCHDQAYWGANWNKVYRAEIIRRNAIRFQDNISIGEDFYFNLCYLRYVQNIMVIQEPLYDYVADTVDSLSKQNRNAKDYCLQYACIIEAYDKLCKLYMHEIENYVELRDRFVKIAIWDTVWIEFINNKYDFKKIRTICDEVKNHFPPLLIKHELFETKSFLDIITNLILNKKFLLSWILLHLVNIKRIIMRMFRRIRENG